MFDGIRRVIALHELKGWVGDVRAGKKGADMKKLLTALDGYKLLLGVVIVFGVKVYDGTKGTHYGDLVGSVLSVFGWDSPDAGSFATEAVGPALVLVGVIGKVYKAQKQIRAGSSVAGALSTEGYVVAHEVAAVDGAPAALAIDRKVAEVLAAK